MRLRAEYCYASHDWAAIDFYTERGVRLNFLEWSRHNSGSAGRSSFDAYLTKVFMYCSTRTLEKQLRPKPRGGISYMPAQDIHLVKNFNNAGLNPWYTADTTRGLIETPEWTFTINQLHGWPEK